MTKRTGFLASCLALLAAAACAAAPAPAPVAASSATDAGEYIIGPGDMLRVFVLGSPDLGGELPVRPDGKVSTPLVPDMVAVGKTPARLAKDIEAALATYVRTPNVSVIVTRANSMFSQIRVVGQAAAPRAIPYRSGMTVLDVVIEVGGLSQFAAGNRAKIVRTGADGRSQEIKVRLRDLVDRGDVGQNVGMQPGDVLVIPEARF
jgi:polysaccharide export outer membrane protein